MAPGRVAQNLAHAPLYTERSVGLKQMLVLGLREKVVVKGRVGLGILLGVDERFARHIRQSGFGEESIP